jgi:hypothetical protein
VVNLSDERDVTDLLYSYAEYVDTRHFHRLGEIFASDAEVDLGFGRWKSLDVVIDGYERLLSDLAGTAHVITNVRLILDGNSCRSTAYVQAWHWNEKPQEADDEQGADFLFVALYRDELVKDLDLGWRIQRRRARRVGRSALAAGVMPESMRPTRG